MPWKSRRDRCAANGLVVGTQHAPGMPAPSPRAPRASTPRSSTSCFSARSLPCLSPMDALVGLCSETRAEHLKRHQGGRKTCPRCRYYLFGDAWTATYGSFPTQPGPGVSSRGRSVWLDERPARWGGAWRLGCSVCAAFEQNRPRDASTLASDSRGTKRKRRTCGVRGGTKFACYDVCHGHLSASHVREHALSEAHCLAVKAHLAPDTPVRILLQTDMDDEQLLRGAVPQPADWLRAWRVCMKPCSWMEAAKSSQTDHYVAQIREHSVKPQAIQSMVWCMKLFG